ncbi:glutaminase A [Bacillus weihaiensis]|uniref:Glutaminase n=1 Tax=Bacillus weihaiensis TaxID=1547283 RepID=A0A1L3MRC0_9BACI|nr:glutaminase A [Bacillus weihaiensis]APH04867.1 glutaminase A [Bacillus weihaiensis]
MFCRKNEELQAFVYEAKKVTKDGNVADYIPALGRANVEDLSIAISYPDGHCVFAGDIIEKMTLQSISKIISLAMVLIENGPDAVFEKVGMEPTGDPFNSIARLESMVPSKPLNPMINAGALVVTHLISGESVAARLEKLLKFIRKMANNSAISFNEEVAKSEYDTADLNRSLCYFLKQHHLIDENIDDLIDLYTKQCAIELNCLDLARIGLVFAMNGVDPITGEERMPPSIAKICKTFMVTCGMYNASGEFAIKIGIPAKSGVSGGIMAAVPGKFGIGIYGPSLDKKGNSIAGIALLEHLSKKYQLSMF